jgi:hypothetical protein
VICIFEIEILTWFFYTGGRVCMWGSISNKNIGLSPKLINWKNPNQIFEVQQNNAVNEPDPADNEIIIDIAAGPFRITFLNCERDFYYLGELFGASKIGNPPETHIFFQKCQLYEKTNDNERGTYKKCAQLDHGWDHTMIRSIDGKVFVYVVFFFSMTY